MQNKIGMTYNMIHSLYNYVEKFDLIRILVLVSKYFDQKDFGLNLPFVKMMRNIAF